MSKSKSLKVFLFSFTLFALNALQAATCLAESQERFWALSRCASNLNAACSGIGKLSCSNGKGIAVDGFNNDFHGYPRVYPMDIGYVVQMGNLTYENSYSQARSWDPGVYFCPYGPDRLKNLRLAVHAPMESVSAAYDFSFYQIRALPDVWEPNRGMYPSDRSFETVNCSFASSSLAHKVFNDQLARIKSVGDVQADYFNCGRVKSCVEVITKTSTSPSDPLIGKISAIYRSLDCARWDKTSNTSTQPAVTKKSGVN